MLICDEATPKKWSFFLKRKNDQYEVLTTFLKGLKRKGIHIKCLNVVQHLRMDNSGENKKYSKILEKENFDIDVKFTP